MAVELTEIVQTYPERQRRRSLGSRIRRLLRGLRWRLALGLIGSAFRVAKAGGGPISRSRSAADDLPM